MVLTKSGYHVILRVWTEGAGVSRTIRYALSDVIRKTDPGNDPLTDWAERHPGAEALWVLWSPLGGAESVSATDEAQRYPLCGTKSEAMAGELERETLRGVEIAVRIEQGYYGEGERHVTFGGKGVARE